MFTLFRKDSNSTFTTVEFSPDDHKAEADLQQQNASLKKRHTEIEEHIKRLLAEKNSVRLEMKKIDRQLEDLSYMEDNELVRVINDSYKFINAECTIDRKNNTILIKLATSRLMLDSSLETAKALFGNTIYLNASDDEECIEVICEVSTRRQLIENFKALASRSTHVPQFDEAKIVEYSDSKLKSCKPLMM